MATRRGSGEGAVYRRGDGKWCASVDLGWVDGRRKRKVLYGKTRAECFEKLKKALRLADEGNLSTAKVPTVETWFKTWLAATATRVSPSTHTSYTNVANYYVVPAIGRKRLDAVTPADVQAMTNAMLAKGLSPRSAQYAHRVLGMAFRAAVRQGIVPGNPTEKVDAPAPRRKPLETLTGTEAKKLLAAAVDESYGPLWVLALTSGMRQGEILALRWRDVDLEVGVVHVREGKTAKSRRTVPLTQVARDALGEAGAPDALVFPSEVGTPLNSRNVLRRWHEFSLAVLGRRTPFHSLRHSAATLMLAQGVPLKVISEMLGHSGIAITSDIYTEVVDALKTDAAARLDGLFR